MPSLNTASVPVPGADRSGHFPGDPALGWPARLRDALARAGEAATLLLTAPGVEVDARALAQLDAALATLTLDALSPIAIDAVRTGWRLDDDDDAALEAWTWALHQVEPGPPDPRCALWTRAAAERVVAATCPDPAIRGGRLPHVAVALPPQQVDPVPLPGFRPGDLAGRRPLPTAAGLDGRPVVLHVLHDWGGGVHRFVDDAMRHDRAATHLALVSHGDIAGGFGQRLALYVDLDRAPIRSWVCDPPIGDMAESHPSMRAALAETAAAFGVGALRVSSLIGASLDVFATGLPTTLVLHDAFPFWPWLDDPSAEPGWDPEHLAAAAAGAEWRFAETRPAAWRQRTVTTLAAIEAAQVALVAPSQAALARLRRLVPATLLTAATVLDRK
ncbi:MAG TPA: hypothetical protein DCM32_02185, partial [Xanthomonadaceae bacterium]|nr:hypothetical protein [Xanthomonadaceae bacterium]